MKNILCLSLFFIMTLCSCKKEQNREKLAAYFNFKVNNADVSISDGIVLNANTFDCVVKGDTALFIDVEKQAEGAGFYIRDHPLRDTTYVLDSFQVGYYKDPYNRVRYNTSRLKGGTITIKKGTFQAADMLNTLEGQFTFETEDTLTHTIRTITNGKFLMERKIQ